MRTVLWTVFLVVALQGIASASTAFASPGAVNASVPADTVSRPEAAAAQPSPRTDAERRPVRSQPQVLSKNFPSPKPVQIYWFFGGR
jgi:hypothetical protein